MFGRFKSPPATSSKPNVRPAPRAPEGARLYAIGDIHGRRDLLGQLLDQIQTDAGNHAGDKHLLFLGDYIDRGPDSRGVIDLLMNPPGDFSTTALRGNHEEVFLSLFEDMSRAAGWLRYGGLDTLLSYQIPLMPGQLTPEKLDALQKALHQRFPTPHLEWLRARPSHATFGDYHFVHAGVRPDIALTEQTDRDRLWIREDFLAHTEPLEKMIIHGHTISREVDVRSHRIGIDTGAYESGKLTALVLEGDSQRWLQT